MIERKPTFGRYIAAARTQLGLSQRALAERIRREDGQSISPQYLHDIEYDRRTPSADHLIRQFGKALKLDTDYLYYLVGRIPQDICRLPLDEADVAKVMNIFRSMKKVRKRR